MKKGLYKMSYMYTAKNEKHFQSNSSIKGNTLAKRAVSGRIVTGFVRPVIFMSDQIARSIAKSIERAKDNG